MPFREGRYVPPRTERGENKPRSFYMPQAFWSDIVEAAAIRSRVEGQQVSASEILRRGAVRELRAIHRARRHDEPYSIPTQEGEE